MKVELLVALVAGAVALSSAALTVWSSTAIESLKIDYDRLKRDDQKRKRNLRFSEPLARAAFDLQSRLHNILCQNFTGVYLAHGSEREKSYVVNNTVFLIAQYLCWTELVRREIQFIDLGESGKTLELWRVQEKISSIWGTDRNGPLLRIFAGEQRAIGEALIQTGAEGRECMGYGTFLKTYHASVDPLIDALRRELQSLDGSLGEATNRLTDSQHALIDLLKILDPDHLRFPANRSSKVTSS